MRRRILVVGGGYAGALCAIRLGRKTRPDDTEIVLAEARPWFTDRIRLHEHAAGGRAERRSMESMLAGTRVRLRVGNVAELDLDRRRATLDVAERDGREEAFDELVLATGSVGATRGVPGLERAWSCATAEQAAALCARLEATSAARVVIVGGGLTGIELAGELGERRPDLRVSLVSCEAVAEHLSEAGRAHVRRSLLGLRVELHEHARVVAIEDDAVVLASGDALPSDATVWCGGFEATPLARRSGLAVDDLGRSFVDARLRSVSHDFVRVIGDAARIDLPRADGVSRPMRMGCVSAMPMSAFCADDIASALRGAEPGSFSFRYLIQCISLGRRNGVVQQVDGYDVARPRVLRGRLGAWGKELICRYALGSVRLERRGIAYSWPRARALPPAARSPMLASRDT